MEVANVVRVRRELANPAGHQLEKRALRAVGARLPDALIQNTGDVVKVLRNMCLLLPFWVDSDC
jgi:hypothetical protein